MKTLLSLLAMSVIVGICCIVALGREQHRRLPPTPGARPVMDIPVVGYRRWSRVNQNPHEEDSDLSFLCGSSGTVSGTVRVFGSPGTVRIFSALDISLIGISDHISPTPTLNYQLIGISDHTSLTPTLNYHIRARSGELPALAWTPNKFVTVYTNDIGKRAMFHQLKPKFPPGSIIVKEKLASPSSDAPELLTVMLKRDRGFDPTGGDWEYMVLNGYGTQIQDRGKLQNCKSCHAQWKGTDYVSRAYLSVAALRDLR